MMSRVREKIPILLNSCRNAVRNYAGAGAGQGGEGPWDQSRSGHRADHRGSRSNRSRSADGVTGGAEGDLGLVDDADDEGQRSRRAEREGGGLGKYRLHGANLP